MYKYKYNGKTATALIGVGVVEPDQEVITNKVIENPNFEFIEHVDPNKDASITGVAGQEGAVHEATLINPDEGEQQ